MQIVRNKVGISPHKHRTYIGLLIIRKGKNIKIHSGMKTQRLNSSEISKEWNILGLTKLMLGLFENRRRANTETMKRIAVIKQELKTENTTLTDSLNRNTLRDNILNLESWFEGDMGQIGLIKKKNKMQYTVRMKLAKENPVFQIGVYIFHEVRQTNNKHFFTVLHCSLYYRVCTSCYL